MVHINFDLSYLGYDLFLDYKGKELREVRINGHKVVGEGIFNNHQIKLPKYLLNNKENEVRIRFVSTYTRDCEGLHYYQEKDDLDEYLYSQFEAACAHKVFPCFN